MRRASVSLKRLAFLTLFWFLSLWSLTLISLWLLAILNVGLFNAPTVEYRHISGSRRYVFGVTGSCLYFVRVINDPNGPPPPNQTGVVSMGHTLDERHFSLEHFYLFNWLHDYRDAFYSPDPAATYDRDHPEKLAAYQRVIELDRKMFIVNFWPIFALVALLPALTLLSRARRAYLTRRAFRLTHCRHCGYDLRATPERCPECGTPRAA